MLIVAPVLAHTVKVSGDVAATFHIEPDHNPRTGKPSLAWFALTRRGGHIIPLSQCNCQLAVYAVPHTKNAAPLMSPVLQSVKADRYQGIPGAEIIFPKAGEYELKLSGSPKDNAQFKPFTFTYSVVVGGN
jgi:hypothetical protein